MSWGQGAAEIASKIAEFHKQIVTADVLLNELKNQTKETLIEFKGVLERLNDRITELERRHAETLATMTAKVDSLIARLDMLSEKALHAAMSEVVKNILSGEIPLTNSSHKLIDNT